MCALFFVGFSPATLAANASALDAMVDVEGHNDWLTVNHDRSKLEWPVSDHCHPALDCSLTAVLAGGAALIAHTTNVTREPSFGDLTLTGGAPTFEPPPPRLLSENTGNSENTQDSKDKT
ncbi:MAG: hypothetical protein ACYTBS_20320 [Planctomycetota bacterium]|jgi:hypothetical protein